MRDPRNAAFMLTVVKIGGNVIDNPEALERFLDDFARLEGGKILVHGGGAVANRILHGLGIEPQMIDGRRVTDEETLRIVTMAYAGWIGKSIVAGVGGGGADAMPWGFRVPTAMPYAPSEGWLNLWITAL